MVSSSRTSTEVPGGGVLGEHEAFSFSRFLRYFRVFLLVMRAGAIQTVYVRVSYPLRTSHIVSYGSVSLHCEKRQEIFEQLCMNDKRRKNVKIK